ncbi:hypothetical protein PVAND_015190 [Polypedilum vanderplanki]|uniref:Uncharacterized protein n=1 Tax=Polypedilum vanderplanki TaxID=319348 RepID=A0A9J6BC14_POLVA|nr:hypothetical protein PVAND_015190 [Polypedilum vanderplanki]
MNFLPNGFNIFTHIKSLSIQNSQLKEITKYDLSQFKNLEYLTIVYNDITIIESDLFSYNNGIKNVDLRFNKIFWISNQIKNLPNVFVDGNCLDSPQLFIEVNREFDNKLKNLNFKMFEKKIENYQIYVDSSLIKAKNDQNIALKNISDEIQNLNKILNEEKQTEMMKNFENLKLQLNEIKIEFEKFKCTQKTNSDEIETLKKEQNEEKLKYLMSENSSKESETLKISYSADVFITIVTIINLTLFMIIIFLIYKIRTKIYGNQSEMLLPVRSERMKEQFDDFKSNYAEINPENPIDDKVHEESQPNSEYENICGPIEVEVEVNEETEISKDENLESIEIID